MQENVYCFHEFFIPTFELNYGHELGICSLILLGNTGVIVMFKSITNLFLNPILNMHIYDKWQIEWDDCIYNKLYEVNPVASTKSKS